MVTFKHGLKIMLLAVLAGGGWPGGVAVAEAGQWVVIAAERVSLSPGTVLEGGQILTLPDGARVTLLAEDGRTLKLTGPYSAAPGASATAGGAKSDLQVIAKLLQGHQQGSSSLGALRGETVDARQMAEEVQLEGAGPVAACILGDSLWLRRRYPDTAETVTLADAKGKPLARFTWPAGEKRLAMPGRYFENGRSYQIQRGGATSVVDAHKAQRPPDNPAARVAWMAEQGCQRQALNLLRSL